MDEDGSPTAHEHGSAEPASSVAERWRLPALDIVQRWTPRGRWLQFASAVEGRHLAAFVRSTPERRELGQGIAVRPPDPGEPGGPGSGYPPAMAGARTAASAPEPDRAGRATQPPGRATRAGFRGPDRAAAPPPPVTARRGEADPRAENGRIEQRLVATALRGLARTLDPHVQGYLAGLLDLRIPAVQIHTGQAADAAARRLNADAVSVGPSIMFRAGRFAPNSPSGLGLLGHELTHIAQAEAAGPGGAPDRASLAREELAALENERRVLRLASGRPAVTAGLATLPQAPAPPALRSTPVARAAAADRSVAPAPAEGGATSPAPELTAQQLAALKDAIYRDLMDRIRTDFERGA
jgi:hypothetical protein